MADEEYVFSLEGIEQYIGQKIPVTWAEESMFVREIRRTPEEKRKAEQERAQQAPHPSGPRRFPRRRP